MTPDSIVEEIRGFRDEIAKEYQYDIDAIFQALRQREALGQEHHVSLSPRRVEERNPADSSGLVAELGVGAKAPVPAQGPEGGSATAVAVIPRP